MQVVSSNQLSEVQRWVAQCPVEQDAEGRDSSASWGIAAGATAAAASTPSAAGAGAGLVDTTRQPKPAYAIFQRLVTQ